MEEVLNIFHSKSLVLVRKGRAFYTTLFQEVFFGNPRGGVLNLICPQLILGEERPESINKVDIIYDHPLDGKKFI